MNIPAGATRLLHLTIAGQATDVEMKALVRAVHNVPCTYTCPRMGAEVSMVWLFVPDSTRPVFYTTTGLPVPVVKQLAARLVSRIRESATTHGMDIFPVIESVSVRTPGAVSCKI